MDTNLILTTTVEAAQNTWAALSVGFSWFISTAWPFIWDWVIIGIVYKAIVARYIGQKLADNFKDRLVKTRSQFALYQHFRDRAMGKGHLRAFEICKDGMCGVVNGLK